MKKKIIAIIASSLGVVLVSALIAAGALMLIREEKVEETGNVLGVTWYSEDEKEFVIDTVDELMEFAALSEFYTFKKQTVKLGADLVFNEGDAKDWEKNAPANRWAPISKFEGTFDGQNHTISGLYAKSYEAPIALFETTTRNAKIQNLSIVNSYFESGGTSGVATFAAKGDGKFTGLYSDAIIVCKGKNSGGIMGVSNTDVTFNECQFAGKIRSTGRIMGGILGRPENGRVNMQHCLFTGDIHTTQKWISWASTDGPEVGGLMGSVNANCNAIISDSYVSGKVSSDFLTYTGVVVGLIYTASSGTVMDNVYTTVSIPGRTPIGDGSQNATSGPIELQPELMTGANAYKWSNLDFDNYWGVADGATPVLKRFAKDTAFLDLTGLEKEFDINWYDPEGYNFTINNLKEMYGFALLSQSTNFAEKTVKLGADIKVNDGKATDWYNGKNLPTNPWFTIGTGGIQFSGTFDGQGHSISGVYLKRAENYTGVFGATAQPSIVKNLKVTNSFIDASGNQDLRFAGGVIGAAFGNVDTIYTDAIVKTDGFDCGGVIGFSEYRDASFASVQTINNCQFDGLLTGETLRRAGGIIGNATYSSGRLDCRVLIKNCLNTGTIQSKVKNYDQINSGMYIGGILGYAWGAFTLNIEDSINIGTLDLVYKTYASAFVGRGTGTTVMTFKNCYATKESASFAGAPVAHGGFSGANTSGDVLILDEERLSGLTAYQYTLLDFDKYWGAVKDSTPQLRSFGKNFLNTSKVKRMIDISWYDETKNSFTINTREQFYGFYQVVLTNTMEGKTFKLGKDIDMNPGWVASGEIKPEDEPEVLFFSINKFAGTFDGNNKVLKGIYIQDGARDGVGLFHQLLKGGKITNVILDNSIIQCTGSKASNFGWYTGGIVGNMLGGSISNIYVKDGVYVKTNMPYCGGIAGRMTGPEDTSITEAWFDGHVISDDASSNMHQGFVGGIVGGASKEANNRVVNNCLMTGTVTGHSWDIGGIFGGTPAGSTEFIKVTIKNSVATGKVTSVNQNTFVGSVIGGLEAKEAEFTLENIYTTEDVENAGTYATDNAYPGVGRIKKTVIKGATSKVSEDMLAGTKAYTGTDLDFWSKTNAKGIWVATDEGPELKRFSKSNTIVQSFDGCFRPDTNWYYKKQVNGKIPANTTFEIKNEAEFFGFAKLVNLGVDSFKGHTVKLTKSIDLNPGWTVGSALPQNESLKPDWKVNATLPKNGNAFTGIGSGVSRFEGTFDGGFNTVKGVYISSEHTDGVGLFARTENSTVIKNLKLDNSYIKSYGQNKYNNEERNDYNLAGWYTGAIAGILKGTIESCYTSPSVIVTSNKSAVGGMVGMFESSTGQIKNCLSESSVVAYYNEFTDKNKDAFAARLIGGIVGYIKTVPQDKAMIESCMFDGIIISPDYIAGGLIGQISAAGVKIEDSYSAGTIYANHGSRLGVVAAYFTGASTLTCENVYATTRLTDLGGTAVRGDRLDKASGTLEQPLLKGYNIVDEAQVVGKRAYTYTNLDFYWKGQNESAPWYATAEGPQLRTFATSTSIVDDFTGVFKPSTKWYEKKLNADGTIPANTTFEIATAGELYSFAQLVDSGVLFEGHTVKLTAKEYDFNPGWDASTMAEPTGEDAIIWNPIGDSSKNFQGTFEGNDAVIKGIYVYQDQVKGTGFFSYIGTTGKVQNFTLSNSFIKSTGTNDGPANDPILGQMTGAVAGRTNGIMESVFVDDSVYVRTNTYETGGLTGRFDGVSGGYIQNCWFDGTIYLDYTVEEISRIVGGLIGEFWDNPTGRAGLKNCLYTGKIYAKNFMLGGLVGQIYCNAVIEDCLSNGEIYAEWGSRLSSIVGWTAGTRTLTFRNVYGVTKLYNYNGTSARDEKTDTLGASTTMGTWKIKPEADLIGTKAYENTLLDLCVKGENEDGVWVALASKAPELKKFSKATDVVNEFDGLFRPPVPQVPITPTDEWFTSKLVDGQVVKGTVFEIATVSDLLALPGIVNGQKVTFDGCTVKLTSAVYDLNPSWTLGQDLPEGANLWTPIGIHQDIVMFKGIFTGEYEPGKYATIRGLYMSYSGDNASGFFGDFQGTARNLKFENSYFNSSKMMLGAVTGRLCGGTNNEADKGSVYNIYVADSVQVVCTANDGVVGGIVGRFSSQIQPAGQSKIAWRAHALKNCWFDGTVEGKTRVGGLVGQVFWNSSDKVLVDDCLFTGIVKASEKSAGGILGHDWDSPVYKNSVSNGIVCCGTGTNLGPVVGEGGNSSGNNTYALAKVYKLDGVTENTISNTKGYIAKTAEQLKACEGVSLDFWSATNTNGVWVATENGPELKMFAAVPTLTSEPQQPNLLRRISTFLASIF